MKCAVTGRPYTVFGYKGKQVRDNIHSLDLVNAFWHFFQAPRARRGLQHRRRAGSRTARCSKRSRIVERLTGRPMQWTYSDANRAGDHIWWVSDIRKFARALPGLGADLLARADDRRDPRRDGRARRHRGDR